MDEESLLFQHQNKMAVGIGNLKEEKEDRTDDWEEMPEQKVDNNLLRITESVGMEKIKIKSEPEEPEKEVEHMNVEETQPKILQLVKKEEVLAFEMCAAENENDQEKCLDEESERIQEHCSEVGKEGVNCGEALNIFVSVEGGGREKTEYLHGGESKLIECEDISKDFCEDPLLLPAVDLASRTCSSEVQVLEKEHSIMPFDCEICNETFSNNSSLRTHIELHRNRHPYACEKCNKIYASKKSLKSHNKILHSKAKVFVCDICNNSFLYKKSLSVHMRVHTKERPFICEVCPKAFATKSNLVRHHRIHTKERPYVCQVCSKAFSDRSSLGPHMRIHLQEKPYGCQVCGKKFTRNIDLMRHTRVHTKEKPYVCKVCSKAFADNGTLRVHKRVHTKEKPYPCTICTKTFAVGGHLRRHLQTHNRIQ